MNETNNVFVGDEFAEDFNLVSNTLHST